MQFEQSLASNDRAPRSTGRPAATTVAAPVDVPDDRTFLRRALDDLVLLIEQQVPGMFGSVLLLDRDGVTLHHGSAPHLPPRYCEQIDGGQIGPVAGSCGTAAYRREQVIVEDIATDPLWAAYKSVALPHGLRACWSTPVFDDSGQVLGTFAMYYMETRAPKSSELALARTASTLVTNILARDRMMTALRESEAKMRSARAEAEHANKMKSDFLAMMSHELRTPLNAIGGYAKLLLEGIPDPATPGQQNFLNRIVKGQRHLVDLIDSVLTHAKLEAGRMTYRMENMSCGELLDVVESLSRPQLNAKNISYDCSGCDSKVVLRVDRQKAAQVMLNLMSNAIKFTAAGGRVTVSTTTPAPGRAAIHVADTGVGMTAEQVATVFEPFVQFDSSLARQEKGTGLGMPISRELARGMGGDLTVASTPGAGTEFTLTLSTDSSAPPA
jgi:signal transduction histidine kinase